MSGFGLLRRLQQRKLVSKATTSCRLMNCAETIAVTGWDGPKPEMGRLGDNGERTRPIAMHGLATCGHFWDCPCCAARIAVGRSKEVAQAYERLGGADNWRMLTLTVRHNREMSLGALKSALAETWRATHKGRAGRSWFARWGVDATIRALEVTWSRNNGWHPHLHIFLRFDRNMHSADLAKANEEIARLWQQSCRRVRTKAAIEKEIEPTPYERFGEAWVPDLKVGALLNEGSKSYYITKLGLEATGALLKRAKGESLNPWQLGELASRGDNEAIMAWREYVAAMFGTRALTWSSGLRKRVGLASEIFDAEIADLELLQDEEIDNKINTGAIHWFVRPRAWRSLTRDGEAFELACKFGELNDYAEKLGLGSEVSPVQDGILGIKSEARKRAESVKARLDERRGLKYLSSARRAQMIISADDRRIAMKKAKLDLENGTLDPKTLNEHMLREFSDLISIDDWKIIARKKIRAQLLTTTH